MANRGGRVSPLMAISFRHYLVLDDGSIRRIPRRIAASLPTGDDAVPELLGVVGRWLADEAAANGVWRLR